MTEYQDEAGSYSGELVNGVPHGQGFKIYLPELYFEGSWEFGYKSGIGFYNYQGVGYCFEFLKGKIKSTLNENISSNSGVLHVLKFDSKIKIVKAGEHYCEQIDEHQIDDHALIEQYEKTLEFDEQYDENLFEGNRMEEDIKNFEILKTLKGNPLFQEYLMKGRTYEAKMVNGLAEGFGKIYKKNQLSYEGELHKGKKWGKGKEYEKNVLIYEGEFVNDEFNGNGSYYLPHEGLILGEFKDGEPYGNVLFIYGDKKYEGELKNFIPHGQGKLEIPKYVYTGEFKNGMKNGFGVKDFGFYKIEGIFINNNHSKEMIIKSENFEYKGEVDQRAPCGKGVMRLLHQNVEIIGEFDGLNPLKCRRYAILSNGIMLESNIIDGRNEKKFIVSYEGFKFYVVVGNRPISLNDSLDWKIYEEKQAVITNSFGGVKFEGGIYYGEIVHQKFDGKGKIVFDNGDFYEGNFSESLINGPGVYKYVDGTVFSGYFKGGIKDGPGKMVFKDKTVIKGTWKSDQLEGFSRIFQSGIRIEAIWKQGKLLRQLKYHEQGENFYGKILN